MNQREGQGKTQKEEMEEKRGNCAPGRDSNVGARKPIREPSHTLCRLLPTLVSSGVKWQYCRFRAPPPLNNSTRNKAKTARIQGLVEPMPSHPVYHFVSAFVDSCISTVAPPSPSLVAAIGVLNCVAQSACLRLVSVPPRHETVLRFDDPPVPHPALLSRPRP